MFIAELIFFKNIIIIIIIIANKILLFGRNVFMYICDLSSTHERFKSIKRKLLIQYNR